MIFVNDRDMSNMRMIDFFLESWALGTGRDSVAVWLLHGIGSGASWVSEKLLSFQKGFPAWIWQTGNPRLTWIISRFHDQIQVSWFWHPKSKGLCFCRWCWCGFRIAGLFGRAPWFWISHWAAVTVEGSENRFGAGLRGEALSIFTPI